MSLLDKFGVTPSLLEAIKKATTPQHPEDVATSANKLEPEGTKKWLATDWKKGKKVDEAEVGSGTSIKDTGDQVKRAKLNMQAAELKMKQEKERIALQKKKAAVKVKEDIDELEESFSTAQIDRLKAEYSKISTIDPSGESYKKLIAMLDKLDHASLKKLADANIKFVSGLARNRVNRANMKKEDVQIDELSNEKLADYKKKAGEDASKADKAGDTKRGNKRFSGIMKATKKQFANDAKEELSPKQKALDKNKNGKIDGSDLAKLRGEELSPKQKAIDKNKNGKIDGEDLAKLRKEEVEEASSPAQQAAIAIAMKKAGKKPKDMEESDAYDKDVKPSDKPHDKDAAAKRAKLAALAARKKMSEGLLDKFKRGAEAKAKANAHWDKAGDPKNPEAKKDLKKAVRYTNLLKKEEKYPEYKTGGDALGNKFDKAFAKMGIKTKVKMKTVNNISINEKSDYEIYHKDYSSAVQTAIKQAEKRGYEVDMDDWHDKVATGPKKPSAGKTNSFSVNLKKDGKESKKKLHLQVYNMDNHKYELNMYIEDFDVNATFSEAMKKDTEATAADNKKSVKSGEKLSGKKEPIEIQPELKDNSK